MAIFLLQALGYYNVYTPWLFSFYYIIIGSICFTRIYNHRGVKMLLLLWILYIIVSGLTAGLPVVYITEEFKRFIAPILFVFVGMYIKNDDLYKFFLYSIFFSVVFGFILLIFKPSWYIAFLINCYNNLWYLNTSENANSIVQTAYRFQSFFADSYGISYFVSFSLCIVMCDIYKKKRIIKEQRMQVVFLLAFVIAIVLSGFRVSIVYMSFMFIWMIIYGIITKNPHKSIFVGALIASFVFVFSLALFLSDNAYFSYLKDTLFERFSDLSIENAMEGSRTNQRETVLASWQDVMLGDGTGSKGAQARIAGKPAITDGGYIKMIVENGIVGVTLFSIIIILTIWRCIKYLKYFMLELLIIGYVLVSMLGANSISMNWCFILPFWFAVGLTWNDKILKKRIDNLEGV